MNRKMDTLELLKKARSGDRVARNQLVEQNVRSGLEYCEKISWQRI